jgi:UDP-glucose 4-epimerase
MKVLITGGAGFIGSHVADAYLAAGIHVAAIDNLSRGSRENLASCVALHTVDICDLAALEKVFEQEKPDIVSHHAAQMDVRRSAAEPAFDAHCNIIGSIHLLDLAVKHKCRRFIFASTGGAIYGEPQELPAREVTPVMPLSPYGISKRAVEHYLFAYHRLHGLAYVALRYGNVYGPRQSSRGEAGVVAVFTEQIMAGIVPTIFGDGSKTRDYVEVSDVARANVKALVLGDNEVINISTGVPVTDLEVFSHVRDALESPTRAPNYAPFRPDEVNHIHLDVRKAKEVLNWKSEINACDGFRRTVKWLKDRNGSKRPQGRSAKV